MQPTRTQGVCGHCHEPNPYTATDCTRCGARLAWAFLIDGKEEERIDMPIDKSFNRLFGLSEAHHDIRCRFCEEYIAADEKICSHCGNFLASAEVSKWGWSLVDPNAPEIKRLLQRNKKLKFGDDSDVP